MIREAWAWLWGNGEREGSTTAEVEDLLKESESKLHEAQVEAVEAEALTESLKQMRVKNQFRERNGLKIQGGVR